MKKADYFVRRGDEERGPTTSARIRELAAAGKLSKDDAIRRGEDGDWFRVGDIKGLFDGDREGDTELIEDPLVNLTKCAAGSVAKAAGRVSDVVKGVLARRAEQPAAQLPVSQTQGPVTLVPNDPPALIVERRPDDGTENCPFCNETIKKGAKKCKHCGEFLDGRLMAPAPPQVVVIQGSSPSPPVQPPANITFAPIINNDNRSQSTASAKSRQKATSVATSFWSRPLSGCGCLSVMLTGVAGFLLLAIVGSVFRPSPKNDGTPLPTSRPDSLANEAGAGTAGQNASRSLGPDAAVEPTEDAEIPVSKVGASGQADSRNPAAMGAPTAMVMSSKLADFVSPANGRTMQMVMVTWKNTGLTPIRAIDAEITSFDASRKPVGTHTYTIFAASDSSPGIAPGHTFTTPKGEGFILPGYGVGKKSSTVKVRFTNVLEHSGI